MNLNNKPAVKKQIVYAFLFLLTCCTSLYAASEPWHFIAKDVEKLHAKPADHRIPYGDKPFQYADLRLPQGSPGPYPLVLIIHGGCWSSSLSDLNNTSALADALRDLGFATWNIEYRRVGNKGGGWPGTFNDIGAAADYVQNLSKTYPLDLKRVLVIGHSAGGHLALWLASRHRLAASSPLYKKNPLPLKGVISLGGIADLKAVRMPAKKACEGDLIGALLGKKEDLIEAHYAETSPLELLPLNTKQILIYGTEDKVVPAYSAQSYIQKAKEKKDSVQLIQVDHGAHHEYVVPNSVVWPTLLTAINSLLSQSKPI